MTESEWLTASDPELMLRFLRKSITERKIRLFAVACCRDIASQFPYLEFHQAVEQAALAADGGANHAELRATANAAQERRTLSRLPLGDSSALKAVVEACSERYVEVENASSSAAYAFAGYACAYSPDSESLTRIAAREFKRAEQANVLRCLQIHPSRTVRVVPAWLTSTVVALAEGIYAERAFDRMPILADALQDAGCDCDNILGHCRDTNGVHVRGCWVVDLILGKT